jgi:hypothetical protein
VRPEGTQTRRGRRETARKARKLSPWATKKTISAAKRHCGRIDDADGSVRTNLSSCPGEAFTSANKSFFQFPEMRLAIMTIDTEHRPKNWRDKDDLDLGTSIERKAWLFWKKIRYFFLERPKQRQCILIPGMQRSGSKLMVSVLEWSALTDCYPEDDRRAFDYFQMRNTDKISELIRDSKAEHFVIKSLCESDQISILLEKFSPARAIWIFRDFRDCVNCRTADIHYALSDS